MIQGGDPLRSPLHDGLIHTERNGRSDTELSDRKKADDADVERVETVYAISVACNQTHSCGNGREHSHDFKGEGNANVQLSFFYIHLHHRLLIRIAFF